MPETTSNSKAITFSATNTIHLGIVVYFTIFYFPLIITYYLGMTLILIFLTLQLLFFIYNSLLLFFNLNFILINLVTTGHILFISYVVLSIFLINARIDKKSNKT